MIERDREKRSLTEKNYIEKNNGERRKDKQN